MNVNSSTTFIIQFYSIQASLKKLSHEDSVALSRIAALCLCTLCALGQILPMAAFACVALLALMVYGGIQDRGKTLGNGGGHKR